MKYKRGDRVRIKTWGKMKQEYDPEYGTANNDIVLPTSRFNYRMEQGLNQDRIVTIDRGESKYNGFFAADYYFIYELPWQWTEEMVECLVVTEVPIREPINRFELMDFDEIPSRTKSKNSREPRLQAGGKPRF